MRILFAGGGTMGSVSPLLAVHQSLARDGQKVDVLWIGTATGPERAAVTQQGIPFQTVASAKLRRYLDWRTFLLPFPLLFGFLQARRVIKQFQPDVAVSAGSFVAVPVTLAAWTRRVPVLIHQQDVQPSLTNRLLQPFASAVTVTFSQSLGHFTKRKTTVTGNPVRADLRIADRTAALNLLRLDAQTPTVLILGGGTGAAALNRLVRESLLQILEFCQVVHLTGRGKMAAVPEHARYRTFEFLGPEMASAYAVADLVVSRSGMGALSELAAFGKPAILVPIPSSHQEQNALAFVKANAAILLPQRGLLPDDFARTVRQTLQDQPKLVSLSKNISQVLPPDAADVVAGIVRKVAKG